MKRAAHIGDILNPAPSERKQVDRAGDEPGLPDLRDGPGRCWAEPAEIPVFAVHFIAPDGTVQGTFGYDEIVGPGRYAPGAITLQFLGAKLFEVTIRGRGLWQIYDLLYQRRVRWIMAAPADRDFAGDGELLVEGVTIVEKEA
jgi:hypothetical protein